MATKTTIEMAREAAGDDWGLFQEYMPEIHRLAELVRADERARMAEQPAQRKPLTEEDAFDLVQQDYRMEEYTDAAMQLIRRTEAAHGIKENS